jgi:hypothetical protein
MQLSADSSPNVVNTINISVVDVADGEYDSAVFLQASERARAIARTHVRHMRAAWHANRQHGTHRVT